MIGAFKSDHGGYTTSNVAGHLPDREPPRRVLDEHRGSASSPPSSAACSGSLIAYAAIRKGTPRWIRSAFGTFSGVAANFGGIPLAFAFIATLGTIGIVTQLIRTCSASTSTTTASRSGRRDGVEIVYLYFQIPLMILVIAPAIDGLKRGVERGRPRTSARAGGSTGATSACRC